MAGVAGGSGRRLARPRADEGPSPDPAVFVLMGVRIRAGAMPYRDLWDHKPPGSYLVNAAGQTACRGWIRGSSAGLSRWHRTGIAVLLIDRLLRRRVSARMAWFWSAVFGVAVASYPTALGGGYTETFALPALVAALWMLDGRPRSRVAVAATGALLGVACLLTVQSVPAALAVGAAVVFVRGDARSSVLRLVAFVGGGVVLPILVLAWLAAGGALVTPSISCLDIRRLTASRARA